MILYLSDNDAGDEGGRAGDEVDDGDAELVRAALDRNRREHVRAAKRRRTR